MGEQIAALTLLQRGSYIRAHGDVAELADAQVSEACDGDIVEVQVLSSPPFFQYFIHLFVYWPLNGSHFCFNSDIQPTKSKRRTTKICHGTRDYGVYVIEPSSIR